MHEQTDDERRAIIVPQRRVRLHMQRRLLGRRCECDWLNKKRDAQERQTTEKGAKNEDDGSDERSPEGVHESLNQVCCTFTFETQQEHSVVMRWHHHARSWPAKSAGSMQRPRQLCQIASGRSWYEMVAVWYDEVTRQQDDELQRDWPGRC